jgi:4-hydroxy-tetrahydrodipicolinate reductase
VNQQGITPENFRGVDVAIEFSTPHVAVANLERLCAIGVPTVVGTTGWYGELERVRGFVDNGAAGVVWSANYSIGVNVFRRVVAEAAHLLGEASPNTALGPGKCIIPRRKTRLRARCSS